MGQFASKEYDGDPYVDLMRALPERELIWWVQKAIWVSDTALSRTVAAAALAAAFCSGLACLWQCCLLSSSKQ
jgi:hypothetical protein